MLILVAAGIVIHTVFYISIAGQVREYGQLRTIGMTKKQVRQLILKEGTALALRGSLVPVLLYILLLFLLQHAITCYGVKMLQKESLVERMKIVS